MEAHSNWRCIIALLITSVWTMVNTRRTKAWISCALIESSWTSSSMLKENQLAIKYLEDVRALVVHRSLSTIDQTSQTFRLLQILSVPSTPSPSLSPSPSHICCLNSSLFSSRTVPTKEARESFFYLFSYPLVNSSFLPSFPFERIQRTVAPSTHPIATSEPLFFFVYKAF